MIYKRPDNLNDNIMINHDGNGNLVATINFDGNDNSPLIRCQKTDKTDNGDD